METPGQRESAAAGQLTGRDVLRRAVLGQRRNVLASALMAAGHQGGEALVPVVIGVVIDEAISARDGGVGTLVFWLVVLGVVFAGLSFSFRFGARAGERASEQAAHQLRLELTERILDPRGGAETGRLPGVLASIATGDARRVGSLNRALPFGLAALTGLLVSAIALLTMSIPLGLLVLLGTPPLLLLAQLLGRPLERRSETERDRAAHASGVAVDLISGLRVLKGLGADSAAIARYRRTSQDALGSTLRAARANAFHDGGMIALNGVFLAIVALVGGRLAAEQSITIGQLVAAVGLAQFLIGPLTMFSFVNARLAQSRASATRIAEVLNSPAAVQPGPHPPAEPVRGALRLRGVSHEVLREVDLDVAAGELLGVVTADPAAATALLQCLGREVDPAAGVVELDGVALSELDITAARKAILVAAHDADLFEGSLLDNVTAAGVHSVDVDTALGAAGAGEVAESLPEGVHTELTERGRSLSGGQRQRVGLARALAADSPVLVVHDPTTAVDAVTEARIADGLRAVRTGKTTVVLTSSPALLAAADRVVVLAADGVRSAGTHRELIEADADYRSAVLA